ncbi:MAG: transposase [Shimia sp.]|nr:transposase [Shimia sp.]
MTLDDARSECEAYRREYNQERPHSAIGNKTPMASYSIRWIDSHDPRQ